MDPITWSFVPLASCLAFVGSAAIYKYAKPIVIDRFDRATSGRYNPFHDVLIITLAHLAEKPEDWAINNERARFPKDGNAAKVTIQKEDDGVKFTSESLNGGRETKLIGYFADEFSKIIKEKSIEQNIASITRALFPERAELLLEHRKG